MPKANTITHVYLFGSLLNGLADHCDQSIPLELKTPSPLWEILDLLPIPSTKVQVAMVNHRAVSRDHMVHPGDRVALFPREYAFFPDWKNFRF